MSICPICGSEITLMPYFDIGDPMQRGCAAVHNSESVSCPIYAAPPLSIVLLTAIA